MAPPLYRLSSSIAPLNFRSTLMDSGLSPAGICSNDIAILAFGDPNNALFSALTRLIRQIASPQWEF
jgi:hypothetical protein